jgi:hypothetical protein
MNGFLTVCYSDQGTESFERGVFYIKNGRKTKSQVKRALSPNEVQGAHFWRKPDPDFSRLTYSICHRRLRQKLEVGDILFFRTLWRGRHYLLGYFLVKDKVDSGLKDRGPIIFGDDERSLLIHYVLKITPALVMKLNPRSLPPKRGENLNMWMNRRLGRDHLRLSPENTEFLKGAMDALVN